MEETAGKGETSKLVAGFANNKNFPSSSEENGADLETDCDEQCDEESCKLPALVCLKILRYTGEACEGQPDGEGVASFEDGHMYKGMFSKGLMDGHGVLILENGLKYEGEFVDNTPTGQGSYTWPDGSTYTGDIYSGRRHGMGSYKCAKHGASYIGQWCQGRRHGEGTAYYNEDKTSWYKGHWVMNDREGSGVRCNVYSGEWRNNTRHGEGAMSWLKLGQRYEGKWKHGVQHGVGRHTWILKRADISQYFQSNQYKGEFFEGQRHGQGTFYYAGGAIYEGEWKNDKKHGQGKFTATDGRVFEGEFVDDRMMTPSLNGTRTPTSFGVFHVLENPSSVLGPDMALGIGGLLEKIPESRREAEQKQVESAVMRENAELRSLYSFYSRLGRAPSPDNTFTLSCLQFWRLLKDCCIHRHGLTLTQVDRFTRDQASLAEIHSPFAPVLLREFLSKLVIVAFYIYNKDMESEKHLLAACLLRLMAEDILPNARKVKGSLFRQPDFALEALKYAERCWEVFEAFCGVSTSGGGEKTMTLRQLMWMFKDLRLFDQQLTAATLQEVVTAENRDCNNQSSSLEQEITFLEFFESLLLCADVKRQQVSDAPEGRVPLGSDHHTGGNLLEEADEKRSPNRRTGNVTAQEVGGGQEVKRQEIPQIASHNEHQNRGQDLLQIRTEARTHQVEARIRTIQQFFEKCFFPAVDHHQSVTRKMRAMTLEDQNSE
ncbi:radial spoke head 10 homolog B isoform X2 [Kryptolebias marmoratus]|uniref:radial spoke head 10 homolog B isoform X2 n=1 Tax=Kryptolebias marmoratus TaxID=37003 RepID=UPI0018ACE528|nr:radial spoke head 10 homolog B isoform X2 [Kryptolebias marmoratus]